MPVSILWMDIEYPSAGAEFLRQHGFVVHENLTLEEIHLRQDISCACLDRSHPNIEEIVETLAVSTTSIVVMASPGTVDVMNPDELVLPHWGAVSFAVKQPPWKSFVPILQAATAKCAASKRAYHRLLVHSRAFSWVTDSQGYFLRVSPEVTALLGYDPNEMKGMHLTDLRQSSEETHHYSCMFRAIDQHRDIVDMINPLRHRDGHTVWVRTNADAQRDDHGRFLGYAGHDSDVGDLADALHGQRREHGQLEALLESMSDWVVVLDRSLVFTEAFIPSNSKSGRTPDTIVGSALMELDIPQNIRDHASDQLMHCLVEERPVRFSFELRRQDYEAVFEVSASPVRTMDGPPQEVVCSIRDITKQKDMECKLQEERDVLAAVLDSIDDVIAIQRPDLTIQRYNRAGLLLLGKTAAETTGKRCYELIGGKRPCTDCGSLKAVQDGTPQVRERFLPEQNRFFKARSIPIVDAQGRVTTVIEHLKDVTDTKRMEKELREDLESIGQVLHSMMQFVLVIDDNDTVQFMNNSAVTKFGDHKGKPWPPAGVAKRTSLPRSDGDAFRMRWEERIFEGTRKPIDDHLGRNLWLEVIYDITDRENAKSQLQFLTYHDPVTGVYNRRYYEYALKEMDTADQWPLGIIVVDVNGLKLTNDAFGHEKGDELLRLTAQQLQEHCGGDGIVCRIGGDEFVLFLPRTDATGTAAVEERIRIAIAEQQMGSIRLSAATGMAVKNDDERSLKHFLKIAEDLMYKDKLSDRHSRRHASIELIMNTLYEKRPDEESHSRRVSEYAVQIGQALGLEPAELDQLFLTGILHDIGKIAVPSDVLDETGPLSLDQWQQIQRHPEIGYNILSSVNDYARVGKYVLAHHERWDGTGYPHGLAGKDIPLPARILAVADAVDAMANDRPHRRALTPEGISRELALGAGSQWDPDVVNTFLQLRQDVASNAIKN